MEAAKPAGAELERSVVEWLGLIKLLPILGSLLVGVQVLLSGP